jgi:predicted HTH domain antitoxin
MEKSVHIEFYFPQMLASQIGLQPENAGQEIRRILALFFYEHGQISLGKACEIGGMSEWEFSEKKWGIPIDYSKDDLNDDMGRLSHV